MMNGRTMGMERRERASMQVVIVLRSSIAAERSAGWISWTNRIGGEEKDKKEDFNKGPIVGTKRTLHQIIGVGGRVGLFSRDIGEREVRTLDGGYLREDDVFLLWKMGSARGRERGGLRIMSWRQGRVTGASKGASCPNEWCGHGRCHVGRSADGTMGWCRDTTLEMRLISRGCGPVDCICRPSTRPRHWQGVARLWNTQIRASERGSDRMEGRTRYTGETRRGRETDRGFGGCDPRMMEVPDLYLSLPDWDDRQEPEAVSGGGVGGEPCGERGAWWPREAVQSDLGLVSGEGSGVVRIRDCVPVWGRCGCVWQCVYRAVDLKKSRDQPSLFALPHNSFSGESP